MSTQEDIAAEAADNVEARAQRMLDPLERIEMTLRTLEALAESDRQWELLSNAERSVREASIQIQRMLHKP